MATRGKSTDAFEQARKTYDGKKFGVGTGPVPLQEFRYTQRRGGDQPNHDLHPERKGGK